MATYEQSVYGYSVVVNEANEQLPPLRVVLIVSITLIALLLKFNESLVFWSIRLDPKNRTHRVFNWLYLFYATHSILFIGQAVDNITRPVHYQELKLFHQKYILTSMELPTLIIIFVIVFGYYGFNQMLIASSRADEDKIHRTSLVILTYVLLSLYPILRYRVSPPTSYPVWINVVLLSGAVSALATTLIVSYIAHMNCKHSFANNSNKDLNNLINISDNFIQCSDDEELETFNKVKVQRARQRTPTKTTFV